MLRLALIAVSLAMLTVSSVAQDAPVGIKRTPLQKIAFPDGYSTVMGPAEIPPGACSGRHTHPGIETGYVFEGEVLI